MASLVRLDELEDRLDWELSDQESTVAESALDDASEFAREYGSATWESATCPRLVKVIILRAVTRYMRNLDGYAQSRAGDEAVSWDNAAIKSDEAGSFQFSSQEIKLLSSIGGKGAGIVSVPISAHGPQREIPYHEGFIPAAPGKPFPMFNSDTSPW